MTTSGKKRTHSTRALVLLSGIALAAMAQSAPAAADDMGHVVCDKCVGTSDIAKGAIRTNRLKNNAVKTRKIADGAVTSAKILDGSVSETDLAFPTATQGELDSHAANSNAHHTATVDTDTLGGLGCSTDQIAKWNGSAWICSDTGLADVQTQLDNLALLASRRASVFIFLTSSASNGALGGGSAARTPPATTWRSPQGYLGSTRLGWRVRARRAPLPRRSSKLPVLTFVPMASRWLPILPT